MNISKRVGGTSIDARTSIVYTSQCQNSSNFERSKREKTN